MKFLLLISNKRAIIKTERQVKQMVRNQPVDVISVCSANGDIQPLRLRLEDEEHQLLRVDILEIISMKPVQFVGIAFASK